MEPMRFPARLPDLRRLSNEPVWAYATAAITLAYTVLAIVDEIDWTNGMLAGLPALLAALQSARVSGPESVDDLDTREEIG